VLARLLPAIMQEEEEAPPPWWCSSWSYGVHQEQNRRRHMEDRLAARDVAGMAAFAAFKRAGFFAVYDG
jgi:hypothetical protein